MTGRRLWPALPGRALLLGLWLACRTACAGPPFLTDDPEPVELHHTEFNLIYQETRFDGGRAGTLSAELNYGCAHEMQCHVALPAAFSRADGGSVQTGVGDAELGLKYRLVDHGDWSAAVYPTLYLPTGDAGRGLGNGRAQLLLPLWVQRSLGPWNFDAGAGYLINPASDARNSWFTGLLAQRSFGDRLSLGAEIFHRSALASGEPSSAGFNVGAIVNLAPHQNLLASLGRGVAHVESNQRSVFLAYQLEL